VQLDPIARMEDIMTRDTTHGTKGSSIVHALVVAMLVAGLFGISALTASAAQDDTPGFDPEDFVGFDSGDFEVPTPLEFCQEQYPDGIVDTSSYVEDALAGADLPPELADEITANFSFVVTCEDVFGDGGM
jgi:hypothetical protein